VCKVDKTRELLNDNIGLGHLSTSKTVDKVDKRGLAPTLLSDGAVCRDVRQPTQFVTLGGKYRHLSSGMRFAQRSIRFKNV
jgi:hypothetical protein